MDQPLDSKDPATGDPVRMHFQEFCPVDSWSPAINLYRLQRRLDVCVGLAGVEPQSVRVQVEISRLVIQGVRKAPQPPARSHATMCILAMEIDHGPFCRTVPLPCRVNRTRAQMQYSRGLLWIRLPLRENE